MQTCLFFQFFRALIWTIRLAGSRVQTCAFALCANMPFRIVRKHALPHCAQTQWNFRSRVIRSLKLNHQELLACFPDIDSSPTWNDITIREARGLRRFLIDSELCSWTHLLTYLFELIFCTTPFTFTSSTALLLSRIYLNFAIPFPTSDGTYHLKGTKGLCTAARPGWF